MLHIFSNRTNSKQEKIRIPCLPINDDDLLQNLFLEVKKLEIEEIKGTFSHPTFKSVYWGPFSGL
jgi:hypothetical protein